MHKSINMQLFAIKNGLKPSDIMLLEFLRDTLFRDVKTKDITGVMPLYFKAKDVKDGFIKLKESELIDFEYNGNGGFYNIKPNSNLILEIMLKGAVMVKTKDVLTVKTGAVKRNKKVSFPETSVEVAEYYNEFPLLPKPSSLTELGSRIIQNTLESKTIDEIKDAIEYASNAQWLIRKGDENWCNMTWVLNNIENFMEGGKYRNGSSNINSKHSSSNRVYSGVEEESTNILF